MVPVILPFVRAEVSAGTANAARIAIIAITTSNSMRVNAEKNLFILIFIWVFFSAGCSEGFLAQRVLFGGCLGVLGLVEVPPSHKATADKCSEGFDLRIGGPIAVSTDKVNNYFLLFLGTGFTRITRMGTN